MKNSLITWLRLIPHQCKSELSLGNGGEQQSNDIEADVLNCGGCGMRSIPSWLGFRVVCARRQLRGEFRISMEPAFRKTQPTTATRRVSRSAA